MNAKFIFTCMAFLATLAASETAHAGQQTYSYTVEHPSYGQIGTYTNTVHDADGIIQMDSQLRVEVQVLGIVVFQEDADRSEIWRANRLLSFRSVSHKDGERLEVSGEATDKGFVVTSPSGKILTTANIAPSDPWAIKGLGAAVVVSTESGKIDNIEVSGGEASTVVVQGLSKPVQHFRVETNLQKYKWDVWFDGHGVPIKFRSLESGTLIDFVLGGSAAPGGSVSKYVSTPASPFYVGAR